VASDERAWLEIHRCAERMLERGVPAALRSRLLSDVLRAPDGDPRLSAARAAAGRGARRLRGRGTP